MRKFTLCSLLFILVFLPAKKAHASSKSSSAGAEITYVWLHDSTYQIFYHLYRDCSGFPEPSYVNLCYSNTCGYAGGTVTANKVVTLPDGSIDGDNEVLTPCPGHPTTCTSDTSTIPDYREWWYQTTLTLRPCDQWTFSVGDSARPPSVLNISGGVASHLYVEATLNNKQALNITAPYFTVKPLVLVFDSIPVSYNPSAYDNNGDSMSFESINPLSGSSCNPSTDSYNTGYSLPYNPIACNNSFLFDTTTGQMYFTPTDTGVYVITTRVNSYRKFGSVWKKVTSVMRDEMINVRTNNSPAPTLTLIPGSVSGATLTSGVIYGCTGAPISFSYDCKTMASGHILTIQDNHRSFQSLSNTIYTHTFSDSVHGTLTWTPGAKDTGLKIFAVTILDSTCTNGFMPKATYTILFRLKSSVKIINDKSVFCKGDSSVLYAVGGSGYTWGVLPGGSPVSSLSCTNCSNPVASPAVSTYYTLSGMSTGCYNNDTLLVKVDTIPAKPVITSVNSPLCTWDTLNLATNYLPGYTLQWFGPGGLHNSSLVHVILPPPAQAGIYKLYVVDRYGCSSPTDSTTVVVKPAPPMPAIERYIPICANQQLVLKATSYDTIAGGLYPDSVNFFWSGPVSYSSTTLGDYRSTITRSPAVAGTYSVISRGFNGCTSLTNSVNVTLLPLPGIPKITANSPVCTGDSIILMATDTTPGVRYYWLGPYSFLSHSADTFIANAIPSDAGIFSVQAIAQNGCGATNTVNVMVNTPPVITAQPQNTLACISSSTSFLVKAIGSSLTYQWQIDNGSGFISLSNNSQYSGANANRLIISGVSLNMNGYRYRCIISGICQPSPLISDTVLLSVSNSNTWIGVVSSSWSNGSNWSCGIIPTGTTEVYISKSANNMPIVDIAGAICDSLFIEDGASLKFSGVNNTLEIKGSVLDHGHGFDASLGAVTFSGIQKQLLPASTYGMLSITSLGDKALTGNAKILTSLRFGNSCMLLLDSNMLTLAPAADFIEPTPSSYIIVDDKSRVIREDIGSGGKTGVIIPIGASKTSYTPLFMSNYGAKNTFRFTVYDGVYQTYNSWYQNPGTSKILSNIVNKAWLIESTEGSSDIDFNLQWSATDELPGVNHDAVYVAHYIYPNWRPGSVTQVEGAGHYSISSSGNASSTYLLAVGGPFSKDAYVYTERTMYVYPNPVSGNELFIKFDKAPSSQLNIRIQDVFGRELFKATVDPFTFNGAVVPLDISALVSGVYIIRVEDVGNNSEMRTLKFVKQ